MGRGTMGTGDTGRRVWPLPGPPAASAAHPGRGAAGGRWDGARRAARWPAHPQCPCRAAWGPGLDLAGRPLRWPGRHLVQEAAGGAGEGRRRSGRWAAGRPWPFPGSCVRRGRGGWPPVPVSRAAFKRKVRLWEGSSGPRGVGAEPGGGGLAPGWCVCVCSGQRRGAGTEHPAPALSKGGQAWEVLASPHPSRLQPLPGCGAGTLTLGLAPLPVFPKPPRGAQAMPGLPRPLQLGWRRPEGHGAGLHGGLVCVRPPGSQTLLLAAGVCWVSHFTSVENSIFSPWIKVAKSSFHPGKIRKHKRWKVSE